MRNNRLMNTLTTSLALHRQELSTVSTLCLCTKPFAELHNLHGQYLHPEEQLYLNSLPSVKRQYSFLLGRYCAKQALAALFPVDNLATIQIKRGIFEQPIVYYPTQPNMQISISHTDTMGAALAFPEIHPMGIDIETISTDHCDIIQAQMCPAEKILATGQTNVMQHLTIMWTAKEALSKVLKCGFTASYEMFEIITQSTTELLTISYFKHFSQYKAISFTIGKSICSIVLPRNTELVLDWQTIQRIEKELTN